MDILLSIEDNCSHAVINLDDPKRVWDKLQEMYKGVSKACVDSYFKLQKLKIRSDEKKRALLRGLREEFATTGKVIRAMNMTFTKAVTELVLEEGSLEAAPPKEGSSGTALSAVQKNQCYHNPSSKSYKKQIKYGFGDDGRQGNKNGHWKSKKKAKNGNAAPDDSAIVALMAKSVLRGAVKLPPSMKEKWMVDSASTSHICNNEAKFESLTNQPRRPVGVCEGQLADVHGIGTARGTTMVDGKRQKVMMKAVLYVPTMMCNLISVSKARRSGFKVTFDVDEDDNRFCEIVHKETKNVYLRGIELAEGLYEAFFQPEVNSRALVSSSMKQHVWHKRLAHAITGVMANTVPIVKGIPRDQGTPQLWVTKRSDQYPAMARIRYVPPSKVELFALRLLLLNLPSKSFEDARTIDGIEYTTFRAAAVAAGLYIDGNEYYTAFQQAVDIYRTPSELRHMVVTSYQQGADPQRLIEAHTDPLYADIVGDEYPTPESRLNELKRRLIQILDRHGGRLIREHTYFADIEMGSEEPTTEVERMERHVLQSMEQANRDRVAQQYASLHTEQKSTVDEIFQCVMSRNQQDRHNTDGRVFFLQGHAGTGKTYLLSVLRDMVEAEGLFVEICATTVIAAKLYRGGRTLHRLLVIGVEDKDASDEHSKLSKYGPDTQRCQLIKSLSLLIVDEASMMQRELFEHVDTILKDLRCPSHNTRSGELPYFGGLTVVFSVDYLQLLPVLPSRRTVVLPDWNIQVIPVSLLDALPWFSTLWDKVKVLRITQQIRQAQDPEYGSLLMNKAKGLLPEDTPLPLKSTANVETAYKSLWRWVTTGNMNDVDLDRMIVCSTNSLVNQHNERALEMIPGRVLKFRSSTRIEPVRPRIPQGQQGQQVQQGQQGQPPQSNMAVDDDGSIEPINPELTYNYTPTGVPPHLLKLKIGVPLMVIRNVLHPDLVNGALFVLRSFKRNLLCVATVPTDESPPETFLLHRIDFQFDFKDFKVTRRQFPVRLAFSATVHKAQGQTLLRLLLDLRCPFFSPGQLYVALSRTRKSSDVLLLHKETDTPDGAEDIHPMPVALRNPILQQAVDFSTGTTTH